jgi:hypothetical protein
MIKNANTSSPRKIKEMDVLWFFLSSGVLWLPIVGALFVIDDWMDDPGGITGWHILASIMCAALIALPGTFALNRVLPRRLAGWLGLFCWVALYVVAWNYSASF